MNRSPSIVSEISGKEAKKSQREREGEGES
jgi:hypothetical protein